MVTSGPKTLCTNYHIYQDTAYVVYEFNYRTLTTHHHVKYILNKH